MPDLSHERASSVRPVDLSKLLEQLELGIGQAAQLCGVSIRQLSYWTDKGIIKPSDQGGSRTYDYAAIEKVCLIKQALDQGYSLEGAVAESEAFLAPYCSMISTNGGCAIWRITYTGVRAEFTVFTTWMNV